MNQPVIEFSNFSFTYHNADSESLTGIDFIIRKGEFILLTGHSGCGKTTLTRCINGLKRVDIAFKIRDSLTTHK